MPHAIIPKYKKSTFLYKMKFMISTPHPLVDIEIFKMLQTSIA